jgi:hypothetical protein
MNAALNYFSEEFHAFDEMLIASSVDSEKPDRLQPDRMRQRRHGAIDNRK